MSNARDYDCLRSGIAMLFPASSAFDTTMIWQNLGLSFGAKAGRRCLDILDPSNVQLHLVSSLAFEKINPVKA